MIENRDKFGGRICLSGLCCICPKIAHLWSAWGYLWRLRLAVHLSSFTDDYSSAAESRIVRSKLTKTHLSKERHKEQRDTESAVYYWFFIAVYVQASQAFMLDLCEGAMKMVDPSGKPELHGQGWLLLACWICAVLGQLSTLLQLSGCETGHNWVQNTLSMQN